MYKNSIIITLLACLAALAFAGELAERCIQLITKQPACCPQITKHTATSYTDCHGCGLATTTVGSHCDLVCPTHTVDATTTVTSCSPSVDPCATDVFSILGAAFTTLAKAKRQGGPEQPCTSTITSHVSPCVGCTVTSQAHTTTKSIDCHGCSLTTLTTHIPGGVCPVCIGGRSTITQKGTSTVTSCKTSACAATTHA